MLHSPNPGPEAKSRPDLEDTLAAVELRLASFGDALRARDALAIDCHAEELRGALARAVDQFTHAARNGPLPLTLRSRLAKASGKVSAQRESLTRATAALDRAIDVLMPRDTAGPYSPLGTAPRAVRHGVVQA